MGTNLHPYCNDCGWRKGGADSWDGTACKCGHSEPAIRQNLEADVVRLTPLALKSEHYQRLYRHARRALKDFDAHATN